MADRGRVFPSGSFQAIMNRLLSRPKMSPGQVASVLRTLMEGSLHDIGAAALLTAWRAKGETASELACAAEVLRGSMVRLGADLTDLVDTCGTGGDGSGTFNISTAAALVVAGAGVKVAKHGNRAVTSQSGASDLLVALGVNLQPGLSGRANLERRPGVCLHPGFIQRGSRWPFESSWIPNDFQLPGTIGQSGRRELSSGGSGLTEFARTLERGFGTTGRPTCLCGGRGRRT